jgi:transposase
MPHSVTYVPGLSVTYVSGSYRDLTGVTGLAIIDAILAGERDPRRLAALRDRRIKAAVATIAKALVGDWRKEHLFALRQARELYQVYQNQIQACDREIERHLGAMESSTEEPPPGPKPRKAERNQPRFDVRGHLHRIPGVDLTALPGMSALTAHLLFSEVGADLSRFRTEKHFTSWLGLCSDNRISGGKPLEKRTRKVASRAAYALRMAAYAAGRSHTAIGDFFRRKRAQLGAPKAITATAHKLARIIYNLLTTRQPYDETRFAHQQERIRNIKERNLHRQAAALGFQLIPLQNPNPAL